MTYGEYYFIKKSDYDYLVNDYPDTFGSLANITWSEYSEDSTLYYYCHAADINEALKDDALGFGAEFYLIDYVYSSQYGNFFN